MSFTKALTLYYGSGITTTLLYNFFVKSIDLNVKSCIIQPYMVVQNNFLYRKSRNKRYSGLKLEMLQGK